MKFVEVCQYVTQTLYTGAQWLFNGASNELKTPLIEDPDVSNILNESIMLDDAKTNNLPTLPPIDHMDINHAFNFGTEYTTALITYFGKPTWDALKALKSAFEIETETNKITHAITTRVNTICASQTSELWKSGTRISFIIVIMGAAMITTAFTVFPDLKTNASEQSDNLWLQTYNTCELTYKCNSPFQIVMQGHDCLYGVPINSYDCENDFYNYERNNFDCALLYSNYSCNQSLCTSQRDACTIEGKYQFGYIALPVFGIPFSLLGIGMFIYICRLIEKTRSEIRQAVMRDVFEHLDESVEFVNSFSANNNNPLASSSTKKVLRILKKIELQCISEYENKIPHEPATRTCHTFKTSSKTRKVLAMPCRLFKNGGVANDDQHPPSSNATRKHFIL